MRHAEANPADALREFLRAGQEDAVRVLPGLAEAAAAPLAAEPAPGEPAARAGECALLLYAALRGQRDQALASRLVHALACGGRLGRALAFQHIQARTLPLAQYSPLLGALPGRHFLALLNDMLQDAPAADKPLGQWLRSLLPGPGRLDSREALVFLASLDCGPGQEPAPLARPLREALLASGLAASLAGALAGNPAPATAEALLKASLVLREPGLDTRALAWAMRMAGQEAPGDMDAGARLAVLLAAPRDFAAREPALQRELRRLAARPAGLEGLSAACRGEPELAGRILAETMQAGGEPAARARALVAQLPRPGLSACLEALPEPLQREVQAASLTALTLAEPDFLRRALQHLGPSCRLDAAGAQALAQAAEQAAQARNPALAGHWRPCPGPFGPDAARAKAGAARGAALAQTLAQAGAIASAGLKEQDFSHCALETQVEPSEGAVFSGTNLSRCALGGLRLRRARLAGARLDGGRLEGCVFQACVFSAADLSRCRFTNCRFEGCSFEACDLSRAVFSGCVFAECSFSECSLAGADLAKTRLDGAQFRNCALSGLAARESVLARAELVRCELCGSLWERCLWRDVEALASSLDALRLSCCDCLDLGLQRSSSRGLQLLGGHTDAPLLEQAATEARTALAAGPGASALAGALNAVLGVPAGLAFARACALAWARVLEARLGLAAMRGQDRRRRALALERLGEAKAQFLLMLPALLGTTVFERARGISGTPPCLLAADAKPRPLPTRSVALLAARFPGQRTGARETPSVLFEAVYAMGSLGTTAQAGGSDVDLWVCASPLPEGPGSPLSQEARAGLLRKFAALEAWAAEEFGLETHYFLMDVADVRANRFGASDKESSGSAQAALLKEEFYRTALKIGGRDLLWWAAPPGAAQEEAAGLLEELFALAPRVAGGLADLGQPLAIPPGEYFGACLWQMVKALHSPYKSVLKLGLLERYAGREGGGVLLCDAIKDAARRGRTKTAERDPYMALFAAIRRHYRGIGEGQSLALLGECLRLKVQAEPEDLPEDWALDSAGQAPQAQEAQEPAEVGGMAEAMRLGGMVSQFMVAAYRRIQEGLRADPKATRISPQDLTRLGRRIAANFAQRPGKVDVVPFVAGGLDFAELCFSAEKAIGKRTVWVVKGKLQSAGKTPVEALPPLRRDTDMVRLLAWLLMNGVYDQRQAVLAEKSLAPIAVQDLQALLAELAAFFPLPASLEPDLDEYLRDEGVAKAFLVLNLPVPLDKNRILSASVISVTNWGEAWCQSFDPPPPELQKTPLAWLRASLARPAAPELETRLFIPKRSACPRIKLL